MSSPHLVHVVTHAMSADHLLRGQLRWMRERGWRVTLVTSPNERLSAISEREGVEVVEVPIPREIEPARDLRALGALVLALRRLRPDVVNASTPKAGLLGMAAARVLHVPARVYVMRGLRLETSAGIKRAILSATERVATACAHSVVPVSASLGRKAVAMGLAPASKVATAGGGSSNGVRTELFATPDPEEVSSLRARLGLVEGTPVVGFVGRFTRDKGVAELVEAFDVVRATRPRARLLLVGALEPGDPVSPSVLSRIDSDPGILKPGFLADPSAAYALMTVLAFPSHREGFPNVPLEAGAAGLPVVAAQATGSVDAVLHGITGTLVGVGDVGALADALARYLDHPALAASHGQAGARRAQTDFAPERIWEALDALYRDLLPLRSRPPR